MHELSLVEEMRRIVEDAAAGPDVLRITRVRVEIGAFATVERDALAFAWDAVMSGSKAEGAALEMILLPGRAFCYDCCRTVTLARRLDPCPVCGGQSLMPQCGEDLRIRDIEVV